MEKQQKWYTETIYKDAETDEYITKFQFKTDYYEIKERRTETTDHDRCVKSITIYGRRTGQTAINWGTTGKEDTSKKHTIPNDNG